jgi:hypothetical protein
MRRVRSVALTAWLSLVVVVLVAGPAAADNCDIFINAEDCQNTGWTVGVIATLAGGVAVATAATLASRHNGAPDGDGEPPPAGIVLRPMLSNPTTAIQPPDGVVNADSMKLVAHGDPGHQAVREVHRGSD